jgi:hypothetical protein
VNDDELVRKLNSVGKHAFVKYFDLFRRYSSGKITKEKSISILVEEGVSNDAGAAIRVGNAKIIFNNSREMDALKIILQSNRLSDAVKREAKRLIYL